jgi:hypothetical protein
VLSAPAAFSSASLAFDPPMTERLRRLSKLPMTPDSDVSAATRSAASWSSSSSLRLRGALDDEGLASLLSNPSVGRGGSGGRPGVMTTDGCWDRLERRDARSSSGDSPAPLRSKLTERTDPGRIVGVGAPEGGGRGKTRAKGSRRPIDGVRGMGLTAGPAEVAPIEPEPDGEAGRDEPGDTTPGDAARSGEKVCGGVEVGGTAR